jgi:DNA (cytosine-5)-methyltransferase 1
MPEKNRFPAVLQPTAYRWQNDALGLQQDDAVAALRASAGSSGFHEMNHPVVAQPVPIQDGREIEKRQNGLGIGQPGDPAYTVDTTAAQAVGQPVPYDLFQITAPVNRQNRKPGDPCHTLARDNAAHAAVAMRESGPGWWTQDDVIGTIRAEGENRPNRPSNVVQQAMTVRRLSPRECERLQGFPDNWTLIPWRKKPASECPDGPRYKALGNSMACNCMAWIGERIAAWEAGNK